MPVAALHALPADDSGVEDLSAVQAGVLAAMASSVALLLVRLQMVRRGAAALRPAARLHTGQGHIGLVPADPVRLLPAPSTRPAVTPRPAPPRPIAPWWEDPESVVALARIVRWEVGPPEVSGPAGSGSGTPHR
ncbi:hypothetical protein [Actinomadura monticuli]|uniref:Uncharacterized protein n=1 Tax=Actinomadura monticuli TaxID=3097367 RepID=A0ABV4Q7G5_9ACTN